MPNFKKGDRIEVVRTPWQWITEGSKMTLDNIHIGDIGMVDGRYSDTGHYPGDLQVSWDNGVYKDINEECVILEGTEAPKSNTVAFDVDFKFDTDQIVKDIRQSVAAALHNLATEIENGA